MFTSLGRLRVEMFRLGIDLAWGTVPFHTYAQLVGGPAMINQAQTQTAQATVRPTRSPPDGNQGYLYGNEIVINPQSPGRQGVGGELLRPD